MKDELERAWWRRWRRTVLVGVTMLAVVSTSTALTGASADTGTTATAASTKYDGESLMRGFLFGLGPAAQEYPELVLTHVEDKPENTILLDKVFAEVKQTDPTALSKFAAAMYSGDRLVIREVTAQTASLLQQTLLKINPPGTGSGNGDVVGQCIAVATVLVLVTAVYKVLIEVDYWIVIPVESASVEETSLRFEKWVDSVATTLHAG